MPRTKARIVPLSHEDPNSLEPLTPNAVAAEAAPDASSRRNKQPPLTSLLWHKVGKRLRHPHTQTVGITLVGDAMTTTISHNNSLATSYEDVIQAEGSASSRTEQPETHIWLFQAGQAPSEIPVDAVAAALLQEQTFVWIDLSAYQEATLTAIGATVGLHRGALRTILSPWHRPSLSVYPDHMYMSATVAHLDTKRYKVLASELDIAMGHRFLISTHKQSLPFLQNIVARTQQTPDLVHSDAAFLLYLILDELLTHFEEINRHIQVESEQIEERALHDASEAFLEDLLRFKRYAFAVSQLVDQHREVFAAFFRPDFSWISGEDIEEYFRDLQARLRHSRRQGRLCARRHHLRSQHLRGRHRHRGTQRLWTSLHRGGRDHPKRMPAQPHLGRRVELLLLVPRQ